MIIKNSNYGFKRPKTPPSLSKFKTYEDWLKLIKIWRKFSDLPANQVEPALVLSLEDEALDAVLDINKLDISEGNGADFRTFEQIVQEILNCY